MRNPTSWVYAAALAILIAMGGKTPARAAIDVDLLLVLAIDGSGSTQDDAFTLQIDGHARALTHPDVLAAIRSGPHRRIAAMAFVWSDNAVQWRCVRWRIIANARDAAEFAAALKRRCWFLGGGTSLSGAILQGVTEIGWAPYSAQRKVIDISGNDPEPQAMLASRRAAAVARGITINGLAIALPDEKRLRSPAPQIDALTFFRTQVIGGPGSFALPANRENFVRALIRKLIIETAWVMP